MSGSVSVADPITRYAYLVGVIGAGSLAILLATASLGPAGPALLGSLVVATLVSSWVPLRLHHRGATQGFTLEEAVFVAMLFTLPAGLPAAVLVATGLAGDLMRRTAAPKVAYNVGSVALWSTAATCAFYAVGPGEQVLGPRSLLALLCASLTLNVISQLLDAELVHRLEGTRRSAALRSTGRMYLVTWAGNTTFGLLLALVGRQQPFAVLLGSLLLVGLYLGYRGYAGVLEERDRTERLHGTTLALVDATSEPERLQRFLGSLAGLFRAERAEMLLLSGGTERVLTWADGGVREVVGDGVGSEILSEATIVRRPVRSDGATDPADNGLAAPVIHDQRLIGAVAVRDRRGLEPWDDTDLTLLASLANEAAVALKNVELFADVERERARLAEESKKLADVVDAASDGIVVIDPAGRLGTWNQAMVDITAVPADEAIGQPWYVPLRLRDLDGDDVLPDGNGPLERALAGDGPHAAFDLQVLRRDGRWRWLRCTVAPFGPPDEMAGVVVVARDVTTERETEELKADFVATVSHELRTPLTPIRGFFELLRMRGAELPPDRLEHMYDSIERQLGRLEALVGDLLTVADLDRGVAPPPAQAVDVSSALRDAIGDHDRVRCTTDAPVVASVDARTLVRVVRALVDNAVKHTAGAVEVAVTATSDHVAITVRDEGAGIPAWERERIFERFTRLGDHLHRTQGPGLGLSIARALARQMGGDITVDSTIGHGSTFTLTVPAVPRPPLELVSSG